MHVQEPLTVFPKFIVKTCEDAVSPNQNRDHFGPNQSSLTPAGIHPCDPFLVSDPFGLRKAVLPVFRRNREGTLIGLGTAVHVDGWGGLLTAEHVVDFQRDGLRIFETSTGEIDSISNYNAVVMLGMGLILGTVPTPSWVFPLVSETVFVPLFNDDRDDPMAQLQGRPPRYSSLDLAGIFVELPVEAYASDQFRPKSLPVQASGWTPAVGEYVLAFGYPQLSPNEHVTESEKQNLIKDGLFAAYGKVTRVYPDPEQPRDRTNPTPCFEVEANWPSGMSGGPVVNESGNVIGIVSRSIEGKPTGVGTATCLPFICEIGQLAPRIDLRKPGWRKGYAVKASDGKVLSFHVSSEIADHVAGAAPNLHVVPCSNRIGTHQYI